MSALVIYDSIFGNTATIAKAIAEELGAPAVPVTSAGAVDWSGVDLLVVGSPTRGFRPTPAIAEFCAGPLGNGATPRVAAFDTRITPETLHPVPLRWMVEAGGYAAERIAHELLRKGLAAAGEDAGFFVTGQEGPLKDGEVARARAWAKSLRAS